MRNRSVLWSVPALVAGAIVAVGAPAQASLPAAAAHVPVVQGDATPNINAHLHGAASIAGNLTSLATGNPVSGQVVAYNNGAYIQSDYTDQSGHFEIIGLFPKTYVVCVTYVSTTNATGFLGRCFGSTAIFNGTPTSGATHITLTSGQHRTGVNIRLPNAAAISGKATTPGGAALANVGVTGFNRSSHNTFYTSTDAQGVYRLKGLTPAANGYTVCFSPSGVSSGTGYRPRCFKDTAWSGQAPYPSGANAVAVSLGHLRTGITQALLRGGAISGRVTDAGNGNGISDGIAVFSAGGKFLTSSSSNAQGNYVVRGLAASAGYRVCAYPTIGLSPSVQYHGKCWRAIAWGGNSLPSGTNPVSVQIAATHTGINFRLSKTITQLGSIEGTVSESAGANPLQYASVTLFKSNGAYVTSDSTDAAGHYKFNYLRALATGYVVCVEADNAYSSIVSTPATGWAPRCYTSTPWVGGNAAIPGAATRVPLSAGQHRTGINVAVVIGGRIDGTIYNGNTVNTIDNVQIEVYTTSGKYVTTEYEFGGTYQVKSLKPGDYIVCFDGQYAGGAGYLPQCYDSVAWNGTA